MPELPPPPPSNGSPQEPLPPPPRRGSPRHAKRPSATPPQRSWGFIIAGMIVGLIVLGAIVNAVDGDDSGSSFDSYPDSSSVQSVTYTVTGDSRQAEVTYENANADTSQEFGVVVPWSYSFTAEPGMFLYISAQRGGAPGDISCSIEVDGQTVETNTSRGPHTICAASGSL